LVHLLGRDRGLGAARTAAALFGMLGLFGMRSFLSLGPSNGSARILLMVSALTLPLLGWQSARAFLALLRAPDEGRSSRAPSWGRRSLGRLFMRYRIPLVLLLQLPILFVAYRADIPNRTFLGSIVALFI